MPAIPAVVSNGTPATGGTAVPGGTAGGRGGARITARGCIAAAALLLVACGAEPAPIVSEDEFAQTRPFLEEQADYYVVDPVLGHVHRPDVQRDIEWPEHADGRIVMASDNLGLRRDGPVAEAPAPAGTRRILISGDSHVDGVVPNSESVAGRLEAALAEGSGGGVEVLNAGVGYYGPFQYGRLMQRYASLAPDVVLVILFMGNDLLDAAEVLESTTELGRPRDRDYYDRLAGAKRATGAALSQGLNQIYYFTRYPEMVGPAVEYTGSRLQALATDCEARGAKLVVALLPTKLDVEDGSLGGLRIAAARSLDLDGGVLSLNRQLTDRLLSRLQAAGIEALDLFDAMRALGKPLYWNLDHHLSTAGHAVVADLLLERYGAMLRATASGAP